MASPPLSLPGIYQSLRAPTLRDCIYSAKSFAASVLALMVGFSQNLENPYWSVLTVYIIVNPPGAGAIRSKAVFRLIGTVLGGALVLAATGMFSDQIGILLTVVVIVIVGAIFLNQIDKTPTSYLWFAVAVTVAVIALSNLTQPSRIFYLATARVGEISLGILMTAAVDCVWPEPMTPAFLETMAGWRRRANDFAAKAIEFEGPLSNDDDRRAKLRDLIKGIVATDAQAVQLPFDVVPSAPRRRALDLVRRQMAAIVANLIAIEFQVHSIRATGTVPATVERRRDALTTFLEAEPGIGLGDAELGRRIHDGEALASELEQARISLDPAGRGALAEGVLLSRLASLLRDQSDFLLALRAVETGRRLPSRLDAAAAGARPVRSVDYLSAALDLMPLVLALTACSLAWYLTAWDGGPTALLFAFAGCVFLVGQGQILQSTAGLLGCVLVSFGLVFFYQFVVLPRVTDFPVLAMVLGCALLPLGLLMAMSMAGMLIATLTFSFLGLQNAYAADFAISLQTLFGSLVGLLIAVVSLRVCAYDHARFAARRLAAAVRRDVIDIACATRLPDPARFGFLALYRLSLYFPAAEQAAAGAPLPGLGLVGDLSVGYHLLSLRRQEGAASPATRRMIAALRDGVAAAFRSKLAGRVDDGALRRRVDATIDDPDIQGDPAHQAVRDDLAGLRAALGDQPRREPEAGR